MSDNDMKDFIRERDEALLSLDKKKLEAYFKKYDVDMPTNENEYWAGIHNARLAHQKFSKDVKKISRDWLIEHGFTPEY